MARATPRGISCDEAPLINKYLKSLLNGGAPEEPVKSPLELGMARFDAGDYEGALPLLEEAIAADGTHCPALLAVARMRLELGCYAEALEPLKTVRELDSRNPQVYYLLGELASAQGDLIACEKNFRKATDLDADFTDAHIRLGMVLAEQRRLAEAVKAFERAIFLDRMAVVARYHLAQVCIEQEEFQRALGQLHMVKELHPDYAPVYVLQGDIFQRLGDHRQAVVEFTKAIELGAGDAMLHYRLGRSHLALKNKEKALRAFLGAIEQDSELWPAYYHAAVLQEELKRYAQAQRNFQAILHVEEYREVAAAAVERISELLAEIAASMAGDDLMPPPPPPPGAAGTGPIGSNATRPL
jgi:tetratricopeptide (TPR) repeat protein